MGSPSPVRVLVVDDNEAVAEALRYHIGLDERLEWAGWLASADGLVDAVKGRCPAVLVLDVDMRGCDPYDALKRVVASCPATRAVMFSGHVRKQLVDRAIDAGAWGYVAKDDGAAALIDAVVRVMADEFVLSEGVREALRV